MQINTQNIQRPQLFSDFFNLELIWDNEYLTYIKTDIQKISKNVTSTIDTIKKLLKSAENKHSVKKTLNNIEYSRSTSNPLFLNKCQLFLNKYEDEYLFVHSKSLCVLFVKHEYKYFVDYINIYRNFSIFNTRSHIMACQV